MSSDDTADDDGGSGHVLSVTTANQFVSTVGGSEDLHLKAGSDCIGVGTDLATTPTDVNIDINGANRDALAATVWDIGAHQYEQVASIGATARDYSTMTLWEADLDLTTIYGAGSRAVGECYNDSVFNESVTVNGGSSIGLTSITLTVPTSERHDGTAGVGVRNVRTGSIALSHTGTVSLRTEWISVDMGDYGLTCISSNQTATFANMIGHNTGSSSGNHNNAFGNLGSASVTFLNCIAFDVYNGTTNKWARGFGKYGSGATYCYNCTAHTCVADTTGQAHGFYLVTTCTNGVATDTGGTATTTNDFTTIGTPTYNASSDSTASGTGSITSITTADQYVSTVGGSEDLHLKEGSSCIGAGTDLVDTPTGVKTDINGANRDSGSTVWDIGAHQYEQLHTIGATARDYSTMTLWEADLDDATIYGGGSRAKGECYNDAEFTSSVAIDLSGGGTIGLAAAMLKAATGEGHDGTAGTGVRHRITANTFNNIVTVGTSGQPWLIDFIEINGNNVAKTSRSGAVAITQANVTLNHVMIHDYEDTDAYHGIGQASGALATVMNTLIYDANGGSANAGGIGPTGGSHTFKMNIYNCVVVNCATHGIKINNDIGSDGNVNNTICMDNGTDFNVSVGTQSNNMASDTTASGTGSLNSETATDEFVSTAGGSEDFHIKAGASAIDAGIDLGTTPTGVNIDINGRDRDAEADTWDIGAHELVVVGGTTGSKNPFSARSPLQGPIG